LYKVSNNQSHIEFFLIFLFLRTNLVRCQVSKLSSSYKEKHILVNEKTPLELELELKLSQIELGKLNGELTNLKVIKQKLQIDSTIENLNKNEIIEDKANNLLKKSNKKILKLTQRVDQSYLFK
jgi:hypothetical protein